MLLVRRTVPGDAVPGPGSGRPRLHVVHQLHLRVGRAQPAPAHEDLPGPGVQWDEVRLDQGWNNFPSFFPVFDIWCYASNRISGCIFLSFSFPQVIHFQWTKQRVTYSSTFSADAPLAAARLRPSVQPLRRGGRQPPGLPRGRAARRVSGRRLRLRARRGECLLPGGAEHRVAGGRRGEGGLGHHRQPRGRLQLPPVPRPGRGRDADRGVLPADRAAVQRGHAVGAVRGLRAQVASC